MWTLMLAVDDAVVVMAVVGLILLFIYSAPD